MFTPPRQDHATDPRFPWDPLPLGHALLCVSAAMVGAILAAVEVTQRAVGTLAGDHEPVIARNTAGIRVWLGDKHTFIPWRGLESDAYVLYPWQERPTSKPKLR